MKGKDSMDRRRFMAGLGAATVSFTIIKPGLVRGTEANAGIRLGMIGCGGRGTWIGDLFKKHGGYEISAAADYFQDRVDRFGDRFEIDGGRRFTGLSCYKRLLDAGVDAVAIESPPCFHPEQAEAAVEAGAHVYLAKPIAVDVPGCRTIERSGKKATEKKLGFLVDFQTRTSPLFQEAIKRVRGGDIGRIVCGEANYQTGRLGIQATPGTPEARLKNWVFEIALSGDIIVEQNIHALDVACWIMGADPVRAFGTGGRKVRTDVGDCWDHFSAIFTFPEDVLVAFSSKQFGEGYDDILCRMYGETGTIDTHYFRDVTIRGKKPYEGGSVGSLYTDGAVANIAEFHRSITERDFSNPTVAESVRSNLATILGRIASYRRREVTFDEMMKANERIDPKLDGLRD